MNEDNVVWKSPTTQVAAELAAIGRIWGILEALHPAQRMRVLAWVRDAFGDQV